MSYTWQSVAGGTQEGIQWEAPGSPQVSDASEVVPRAPGGRQDGVARCLDFSDKSLEKVRIDRRMTESNEQAPPAAGRRALEVAKELDLLLGWLISEKRRQRECIDSRLAVLSPSRQQEERVKQTFSRC
mmetsp:Transcript_42004/g.78036  ORF Transcript_42004/g.78036 Transcript_42004/m.78036 type:complete len:129 (+) Transcript_42004:38-424(+)